MKWKQKMYFSFTLFLFPLFFFFPSVGFAIDFTITNVKIDAYLHEDGQVEVIESHSYAFEEEFNGITREIIPKEGASISRFKATENDKLLNVEHDDGMYKIFRKGEDEAITIKIAYYIKNGVDVYTDVAEFYWPFFDDRNESDYEQMSIVVHPPKETTDVIAFGYDEAFDKERVQKDGNVFFQLGEVPAGENGDIRVAYDAALFPAATLAADKVMKDEILKAEQGLHNQAAKRAKTSANLSVLAWFIVPFFSIVILLVIIWAIRRRQLKNLDVERSAQQSFFIPQEKLSIPATIYFIKRLIPTEAMAAAFLDLVRKGMVVQTEDASYIRNGNQLHLLNHEKILVEFLFDEIGTNGKFRFEDLANYTENTENHAKYYANLQKWQRAVMTEGKEKDLYENNGKLRWTLLVAGVIQLPLLFLFPAYGLFGWFFATLFLVVVYFLFAIAYRTKNIDGLMIHYEWDSMKEKLPFVSEKEWGALTNDEQMRAYILGIGMNDKTIIQKNEERIKAFNVHPSRSDNDWGSDRIPLNTLILMGPLATSSFHSAQKTTEATTSSATSTYSGGGVGGGGGGSGAF